MKIKGILMKKASIVIYCDGGANPNPSLYTGYGVHAFIVYEVEKPVAILGKYAVTDKGYILKPTMKTKPLIKQVLRNLNIFPDSLEHNKDINVGKIGPVLDLYGNEDISKTNNMAELDAVINAFKNIEILTNILKEEDVEFTRVTFLLDSTYVLGYFKKILLKMINTNAIETNAVHIKMLESGILNFKETYKDTDICLGKVKAHSGDLGNEKADTLATMGINNYKLAYNNDKESLFNKILVKEKYWSNPEVNMDLFYYKQLFVFYKREDVDNRTYFGLNYKDPSNLGKGTTSATYTIVKTEEPVKIVNDIIDLIYKALDGDVYPFYIDTDNLTNKNILREYLLYKEDYIIIRQDTVDLLTIRTPNKVILARIMFPPSLSVLVMEKFHHNNFLLENVANEKIDKATTLVDITDKIYTKNKKDKTIILPEFINDKYILKHSVKVEGFRGFTLRIMPKLDLPNRNVLKRYESLEPKVTLIMLHKFKIIEYMTMIELNDGTYVYSNNFYSNKVILKPL